MPSRPIIQMAGSGRFAEEISNLLNDPSIVEWRAVVAFATLDGVLLLGLGEGSGLRPFLERGGRVDLLVGVDSVTTDDGLRQLRSLAREFPAQFQVQAFSSQTRSLFHPKIYLFGRDDGSGVVLNGSNNLTRGGLTANTECASRDDLDPPDYSIWATELDGLASIPGAVQPISDALLQEIATRRQVERRMVAAGRTRTFVRAATDSESETRVLLQMVPRSGGRLSQVGIQAVTMSSFFDLHPGLPRTVRLQQVQAGGAPGPLELRSLVHSTINRNSRIEVRGLSSVTYPISGDPPILVFEDIGTDLFRYMVLMPGDAGYQEISNHLRSLPRTLAMPHQITTIEELLKIWPNYPT